MKLSGKYNRTLDMTEVQRQLGAMVDAVAPVLIASVIIT